MNNIKLETIKEIVNILEQQIAEIENKYEKTKQEFEVGDVVYYNNPHGKVVPAIVDEIYKVPKEKVEGSFVFYWIHEQGYKINWWNKFTFFLLFNIPFLHFRYRIPKGYPGHGVLAGDDIFRTKQEAEDISLLYNMVYDITEYKNRYLTEK